MTRLAEQAAGRTVRIAGGDSPRSEPSGPAVRALARLLLHLADREQERGEGGEVTPVSVRVLTRAAGGNGDWTGN